MKPCCLVINKYISTAFKCRPSVRKLLIKTPGVRSKVTHRKIAKCTQRKLALWSDFFIKFGDVVRIDYESVLKKVWTINNNVLQLAYFVRSIKWFLSFIYLSQKLHRYNYLSIYTIIKNKLLRSFKSGADLYFFNSGRAEGIYSTRVCALFSKNRFWQ